MKGWLAKRGPMVDFGWEKRWCVLSPREHEYVWHIEYFVDSTLVRKKGDIPLVLGAKAVPFRDAGASTGDCSQHARERPCGFIVDLNPKAGKERHLYYFDAGTEDLLKAWTAAINSAAEACAQPGGPPPRPGPSATGRAEPRDDEEHRQLDAMLQSSQGVALWKDRNMRGTFEDSDEEAEDVDVLPASHVASERALARRRGALSAEAYGEWNHPRDFVPEAVPKSEHEIRNIREALLRSPFLQALAAREEDLRTAVVAIKRKHAQQGDEVITQGNFEDNHFFILESGSLDVFLRRSPAEPHPGRKIRTLDQPWCSFGELSLLHNAPRAATLVAREPCELWSLDREVYIKVMRDDAMRRRERHMSFLRSVKLLDPLDMTALGQLVDAVEVHEFVKGEFVVRAGESGDCFFIVEEGEAMARINGMDARSYKRGGYFGELSLINDRPRAADVVAESDVLRVVSLDRYSFKRLLGNNALFKEAQQEAPAPASEKKKAKKGRGVGFAAPQGEGGAKDPDAAGGGGSFHKGKRGTGFVDAEKLMQLLAEAGEAEEEEEEPHNGRGVKFDACAGDGVPKLKKRGTGYVHKDQLLKILGGEGDADDGSNGVHFSSQEEGGQHGKVVRKGTGYIQVSQLKKLLQEAGDPDPEDGDDRGVRFAEGTSDKVPAHAIHRKGTGYIQAGQLSKLLAERHEADGDDAEGHVRFDAGAGDAVPRRTLERKGTGFIQASQLEKLLAEAGLAGDDPQTGVHFDAAAGAEEPGRHGIARKGTGFVQASQLKKILARADMEDDEEEEDGPAVQFSPSAAGDGAAKKGLGRKGTGFVQASQLKKLLAEAGEEEEDEEGARVRFAEGAGGGGEQKPQLGRKGTGFVQAGQLRKLLQESGEDEEEDDGHQGVRFDRSAEGEPGKANLHRKGTGFIQIGQLKKLLADAGDDDDNECGKVHFDGSCEGGEPKGAIHRKGTGFIQVSQLKKLLQGGEGGSDDEDEDEDEDKKVRFDAGAKDDAPSECAIHRKGTGFVQVGQLKKLLAEAGADHEEDEEEEDDEEAEEVHVRFGEGVGDGPAPKPLGRKGTGFVQASQLKKLLGEAGLAGEEGEEEDPRVHFEAGSGDDATKPGMARKGTGFIQASQLRKLLQDVGDNDDDEAGEHVRFAPGAGEGDPDPSKKGLGRKGTGFVHADQLRKLLEEAEAAELSTDADDGEGSDGEAEEATPVAALPPRSRRSVSFVEADDQDHDTSPKVQKQGSRSSMGSRHSAGEIFVDRGLREAMAAADAAAEADAAAPGHQ